MNDSESSQGSLPTTLTLDEAFRAAYCLARQYVSLEADPDDGLVLFVQYLHGDPARWEDWRQAVRTALGEGGAASPLT